jgi:hypothetical protein
MIAYTNTEALELLCKELRKWCLYMNYKCLLDGIQDTTDPIQEINKAIPFLTENQICEGKHIIFCETEEEVFKRFEQVVGDDGPTELNHYKGPARVECTLSSWVRKE